MAQLKCIAGSGNESETTPIWDLSSINIKISRSLPEPLHHCTSLVITRYITIRVTLGSLWDDADF